MIQSTFVFFIDVVFSFHSKAALLDGTETAGDVQLVMLKASNS